MSTITRQMVEMQTTRNVLESNLLDCPIVRRQRMKKYQSHKVVEAFKIGKVHDTAQGWLLEEEAKPGVDERDQLVVPVLPEYIAKHQPPGGFAGGWYVRYEDGYESWSPAAAFESSYTEVTAQDVRAAGDEVESALRIGFATDNLTFSDALDVLKQGGTKVARSGWNGKGMWLTLSPGSDAIPSSKFWAPANRAFAEQQPGMTARVLPYITMKTADGAIVPWLASQTDLLADDWMIVE